MQQIKIPAVIAHSALANHYHGDYGHFYVKSHVIEPAATLNEPFPYEYEPLSTLANAIEAANNAMLRASQITAPGRNIATRGALIKHHGLQQIMLLEPMIDRPNLLIVAGYLWQRKHDQNRLKFTVTLAHEDDQREDWPLSSWSLPVIPPLNIDNQHGTQ